MDEKLIDQLYSEAVGRGYKKGKSDFISLIKSDDMAYEDMYSYAQSKGLVSDATQFGSMVGRFQAPYKKKEEPALGLPEQMFQTKPQEKPEQKPRVSPTPVGRGVRRMAAEPATALPSEAGLSVSQGIEQPLKPSVGVVAESTAMPKIDIKAIQEQKAYEKKIADETPKEVPYFTGTVGTVLSAIDSPYSPVGQVGVGDFIDDMGRAIASGLNQGDITTPANILLLTGKNSSPDQIKKYIAAVKDYEKIGASEEMIKFSKTYQDEGKTVYGFLKGLAENPGVIGELIVSSATAMLNPSSLAAAGAVTGGFAAAGAAGAAPGAAAGALSSIPWAIGAAGTALETGLTFSELLKERLQERNLEFTEENVKTILEDEKALNDIRTKSLARGATIGAVDALTGRLAGKVGAKLLGNTPASRVKAGLAGAGIEMVGGSVGEAAGRVAAGQELDVAEIGLEGIAEGPMAIADVTAEVLRRPIYKVNGERRNESDIESIISTASPEDLYKIDIDIKNDVKGYRKRIQDIIVDDQMRKEIRQANPNVDDATINTLLGLEKELKTFENNKTQSGKDRAAAIRSQIKTIQQDAVQIETAGEVPVQPRAGVGQEVAEGITEAGPEVVAAEGVQEIGAPETEKQEVARVQSLIGTPEGTPKFSVTAEGETEAAPNQEDVDAIAAEMNKMSPDEINFTEPEVSQEGLQVDPVAESKSIIKPAVAAVKGLLKKIQDFNGIPMLQGMSDMLAAGRIKDSAGNDMDVEGGLLFNVVGKNKNAAWAGVSKERAQEQYDNAVALYNSNKELFDRLWAEGKLPDGHIPMAIMRMADTAVHSNEATFRWALPTIEALPEENRKNAMNTFAEFMQNKLNTDGGKVAQKVLDFIAKKNITSLDQLFKEVISDANVRTKNEQASMLTLTDRGFIYDAIFSPAGTGKASMKTVSALFDGIENPNTSVFLSDTVYDAIGEPSMRKMKQGEVAGIVGIDVKNGGVIEVEHGNYGYGPKGKAIALISNPKHGIDVFSEYKAKASRVFKKNKKGETPSEQAVAQQTGGTFFGDAAFRGAKVMAGAIDDLNLLIGKLRFAFPSVSVSTTPEEFQNVINQPDVRTHISEGKVVLGLTKDGKIYLNPEIVSLKTPIHEFGHVWIDFLRSKESGKKGTELLNRGLELVVGTEEHKKAVEQYGDTELAKEEALVELMANKGATIIDAAKKSQFKSWMNAVFKFIKEKFTTFKGIDRNKIADMSLEDFINTGLADLFSGEMVSSKFAPAKAETAARARMSTSSKPVNELPGYDKLMDDVTNTLIPNALRRKLTGEEMIKMVKKFVAKSDIYKVADDIQRDELVRQINGMLGEAYKNAPSAQKILGIKKTKVEVKDELKALNDQLKLETKAAREAKADLNTKRKQLMDSIRKMAEGGKISARNVSALLNKIGNLNLDSQTAVNKFTDYASKVFADADYADKLSTANSTRKKIRKISKDTDKSANLRTLGGKFSEIDPSMVDDIDTYNEIAAKVLESIKGSSIRGTDVKFAGIVSEADTMDYINNTLDEQQKKMFDQKVEEIKELLGVDVSGLTYDQIMEMVQGTEPVTKYNDTIIRDAIRKAFDIYSTLIRESIATGKDPMTGDKVSFTDAQKKTINAFMNMDLDLLNAREALNAVDGLVNFIQNGSTAKMDAVVSEYTGKKNVRTLANRGIKASPIKKYWSPAIGKLLAEQVINLNVLFERMFKGFTRGGMVEDMSGVTALKNGKSNAQAEANRIVDEYVDKFYKKQANFGDFNTSYNNIERGMAAFLTRSIVGTDAEMKADFERRKGLVEQSIEVLSQGNEAEVEKSVLYQDVYNSIASDAKTLDDVLKNVDPVNLEAINFWQDKWAVKYDQLADVSLNIYNKVLGRDINFTPDRFTRLSYDTDIVEISNEDMAFHYNNGTPYKKETGVLMEATRPNALPVNEKSKEVSRYIDLSFDKNNSNSMYDALVDIKTAGPIRQVESFLNSSYLKKVVPDSKDADILKDRINLFVRNIRKKNPYSNDELSSAVRKLNRLAAIGVGQALGGVLQPVKQVIPVAMNTLINANGNLDIASIFDKAKNDFISKSGYAIANRGIESQAQVESLNKLIDEAAKSNIDKAVNLIDKANRWWLKNFLANADVFIARTSWITYYQQSLKNQGIDPSTIDYATHELNEEAANYAQRQVDRQQNVSDSDLAGELLLSNEPIKQIFVKMLMPFSSFRMNQSARLGSDLATLTSNTSTQEDKKIARKSLVGFGVENLMFKAISAGSILLTSAIVSSIMGDEEDEKEKQKKKDMIVKGQLTSTVTDLFSPLPFIDPLVQMGASFAMDKVQQAMDIPDDKKLSIYSGTKEDFTKSLGLFGISADRAAQLYELSDLAYNGKFEDKYGKEKLVTPDNRETLKYLIGPAILTNIGLAPTEVNSVIRGAIRNAKLNAANPVDSDKQIMKILLQGYESKSDMERYDPKLYEETFGEKGIEQYVLPLNVIEREINKEMNKAERDIKDRIYNYKPKEKGEGGFGSSKFGE